MPLVRARRPPSQFPYRRPMVKVLDKRGTQTVKSLHRELRRVLNVVRSDCQKMLVSKLLVLVLPRQDLTHLLPALKAVHSRGTALRACRYYLVGAWFHVFPVFRQQRLLSKLFSSSSPSLHTKHVPHFCNTPEPLLMQESGPNQPSVPSFDISSIRRCKCWH